jgi:hypothetical protein
MGIRKAYVEYIEDHFIWHFGEKPKMLELGNQYVRDDVCSEFKTGKDFWSSKGFAHTSIDINGKDGAIKIDMSKTCYMFNKEFDIVTDLGFSCCVNGIWTCFKNMYNMCKDYGIVIHILPAKGSKWNAVRFSKEECLSVVTACNCNGGDTFYIKEMDGPYGKLYAFSSRKIPCAV